MCKHNEVTAMYEAPVVIRIRDGEVWEVAVLDTMLKDRQYVTCDACGVDLRFDRTVRAALDDSTWPAWEFG